MSSFGDDVWRACACALWFTLASACGDYDANQGPRDATTDRATGGHKTERDAAARDADATDGPDAREQDAEATIDDGAVQIDPDAGAPPVGAALPTWAQPLQGRYARRAVRFGYDAVVDVVTMSVELDLVTVTADPEAPAQLQMDTQLCALSTLWEGGTPSLVLANAELVPPTRQPVTLGSEPNFSTGPAHVRIGFDSARLERCNGSAPLAQVARYDDQTWLRTSTCQCPENPAFLPSGPADCRLTDADRDGKPGMTLLGTGPLIPAQVSVALDYSNEIVGGEVRANRQHVLVERNVANSACVNGVIDGCSLGSSTPCNAAAQTLLVPLDGGGSCSDVRQAGADGFAPLPPFPRSTSCTP